MNLREAAQQALEALEVWRDSLTDPSAIPGWRFSVVGEKAVANLRAALTEDAMQRLTDVQQEIEDAVSDQATYGMSITLGGKRIDPASIYKQGVPQDHIGDADKMVATSQESRQVEPVAWLQIGIGDHEGTVIATTSKPKTWNPDWWRFEPLYTAPPQHAQTWTQAQWTEYERGIVATERERIAAWVEDMCAGLDAKTIANGIRNGGNDDIRAFEVRK